MNRRDAVSAVAVIGASAAPIGVGAQQTSCMRRIGFVFEGRPPPKQPSDSPGATFFRSKYEPVVRSFGWEPRTTLCPERRYAEDDVGRIPALYEELVREKVDILTAFSTSHAVSAARATKSIPIVMFGSSAFPVECGLIESFARPGGNVTGMAWFQGIEVQSKLAQFARDILPQARRLAWIAMPNDLVRVSGGYFRPEPYYAKVARALGFELGYYECRTAEDFDSVFAEMHAWGAHAVIVDPAQLSWDERDHVARLALQARLPGIFGLNNDAVMGELLSYAPDLGELIAQAAGYVGRILNGARPADLPVEMPRALKLVIHQRTARAIGVTIPRSLLTLADQVVE